MTGKSWALLWVATAVLSGLGNAVGAQYQAIDLTVPGYYASEAMGTDGAHQVGYGDTLSTGGAHALLWAGSAEGYVDLNPSGFDWL